MLTATLVVIIHNPSQWKCVCAHIPLKSNYFLLTTIYSSTYVITHMVLPQDVFPYFYLPSSRHWNTGSHLQHVYLDRQMPVCPSVPLLTGSDTGSQASISVTTALGSVVWFWIASYRLQLLIHFGPPSDFWLNSLKKEGGRKEGGKEGKKQGGNKRI